MPPTATTVAAAGRPPAGHPAVLVVLVPLVGIAAATVATTMPPLPELLARKQLPALIALLALAIATTAFPAPLAAGVTVRFAVVAVVLSTAVLYGPALAAFVASVAELVGNIAQRKTFLKVVYNVTSALLGGAAAGVVASALGGT
ncbi:MAG: hypothetical protein ACXW0F_11175, partial [Gaiellaceae bacterium]